ncbi:MAG: hypothetical protein ICV54_28555 [Nostoc sp. C3-bin3]|nr:hypothetical protein [Nostoc sp. C3-bin3]
MDLLESDRKDSIVLVRDHSAGRYGEGVSWMLGNPDLGRPSLPQSGLTTDTRDRAIRTNRVR